MSEQQQKQEPTELSQLANEFEQNLKSIPQTQKEEQKLEEPQKDQQMEEQIKAMFNKQSPELQSTLYTANGEYLMLDDFGELKPTVPNNIMIIIEDKGEFNYLMRVLDSNKMELQKLLINQNFNFGINITEGLFKWVKIDESQMQCYSLKSDEKTIIDLNFYVERCLFEKSRKIKLSEVVKDQDENIYQERQFKQNEKFSNEIIEDCQQFYEEENIEDTYKKLDQQKSPEKNKTLVQAKLLDRTFVSKGQIIDVYQTNTDNWDQFNLLCSLPPVKTYDGQNLTPKKLIMHGDDSKLIILDSEYKKKAYNIDIEKGVVFQELAIDAYNNILDLAPEVKHGDLVDSSIFIAMNQKNLFKLDSRMENMKVSEKIYAKNYQFNSLATTNSKNIVLGSGNGEIRLFNDVGKKAKNMFVGMGDPISFIDTTKDGKWILCTCKKYLIFLPAIYGSYNVYNTQIKYEERQIPRKLGLSPNDIAKYKIQDFEFTQARFDDSKDSNEQFIITSVENYLIVWNVKKVIQGKVYDYKIKKLDDKIIQSEYKFGSCQNVLVGTLNGLQIEKFKNK